MDGCCFAFQIGVLPTWAKSRPTVAKKENATKFKPDSDTIAVTIPRIRLLRNADGMAEKSTSRENELYYVSVALDANGTQQKQLDFGHSYWPAIRRFEEVQMTGHGSLVYGPKNPGAYVAYSILFLESDAQTRERGERAKIALGQAGKVFDLG